MAREVILMKVKFWGLFIRIRFPWELRWTFDSSSWRPDDFVKRKSFSPPQPPRRIRILSEDSWLTSGAVRRGTPFYLVLRPRQVLQLRCQPRPSGLAGRATRGTAWAWQCRPVGSSGAQCCWGANKTWAEKHEGELKEGQAILCDFTVLDALKMYIWMKSPKQRLFYWTVLWCDATKWDWEIVKKKRSHEMHLSLSQGCYWGHCFLHHRVFGGSLGNFSKY